MALLAYNEPEKSPMFHLLSLEYRQEVADSLNRAILGVFLRVFLMLLFLITLVYPLLLIFGVIFLAANSNLPSYSAVEKLMQQTTVVRQCLSQESSKV